MPPRFLMSWNQTNRRVAFVCLRGLEPLTSCRHWTGALTELSYRRIEGLEQPIIEKLSERYVFAPCPLPSDSTSRIR